MDKELGASLGMDAIFMVEGCREEPSFYCFVFHMEGTVTW